MEGKQIGGIILSVVGILIGIALLTGSISGNVGTMTNQVTVVNATYTAPAGDGTIDLTGQEVFGTPIVTNATHGTLIGGNYTIDEGISATTSYKTVRYTTNGGTWGGSPIESIPVNISYIYGADGYVDSSGGRAFASLIILFVSMGIAFISLRPTLESWGYINFLKR